MGKKILNAKNIVNLTTKCNTRNTFFVLLVSEYTCYTWIKCTRRADWGLYWVLDFQCCFKYVITEIKPLIFCYILLLILKVCVNSVQLYFLTVTGPKLRWESQSAFYSFCECRRTVIWTGWVKTVEASLYIENM